VLEAQLNAQMIRIARKVVAVTDSSKLLRRNLSVISPVFVNQKRVALSSTSSRERPRAADVASRRGHAMGTHALATY